MIPVPQGVQDLLAAMTDNELRGQINEKRRDLAYGLWEARRRGYAVGLGLEEPSAALNDNEAREILIYATKRVDL